MTSTASPMPTLLQRIALLFHLLNSLLLHLLPPKLSFSILLPPKLSFSLLLPSSWLSPLSSPSPSPAQPLASPPPPSPTSKLRALMAANDNPSGTTVAPAGAAVDPAELKRVFQMFDRNGDGSITKKELFDSLEKLGILIPEPELSSMIEKIDVNGDGCVDIEEFGTLYESIMGERDEEEDMLEAFNVFDQNGDGFITVEELRSVLASLGLKQGRTVEDCKRMIEKVDVDGDGMVNYKEFKQMMRGGGFAALS